MSREALLKSIEHWKRLAHGSYEQIGAISCALCRVYYDGGCRGCPVMERTGRPSCLGTPWEAVWRASFHHGRDSLEFIEAAKDELAFLQSLLKEMDQ